MKNILFPTAYATHSKAALRYAQKLAQYFKGSITMVHVYETPTFSLMSNQATMEEFAEDNLDLYNEECWRKEMKRIKEFADEMTAKQFEDIPIDFIVSAGNVVDELMDIQIKNDFDLIVMGMSRHKFVGKILGNTTYSIIDNLDCPILLLPPEHKYLGIEKIIYGTAFEIGEEKIIDQLLDWCLIFNATLNVLHVHDKRAGEKAFQQIETLKKNYIEETDAGVITFQLLEGEVSKSMEEYREFTGSDILAVHKRKKGIWHRITSGSLTKQLVEEMVIPVLVFKN